MKTRMMVLKSALITLALLPSAGTCMIGVPKTVPVELKTEMLTEPAGLDTVKPRFSWIVADPRTGARQTAYQVRVASSPKKLDLPDLWDSGKITSDLSHLVEYAGKPLTSRQQVWWQVRVWDQEGKTSDWSAPARFEIALLDFKDWQARWITAPKFAPVKNETTALWSRMVVIPTATNPQLATVDAATKQALQKKRENELDEIPPAPLFRKTFLLPGKVKSARLYIAGLGFHEVTINGRRVDDAFMAPAESHYSEYTHYMVRDVVLALREGDNVIGVLLGNGRYNEKLTFSQKVYGTDLPLIAQLEVKTDRGDVTIVSDESWQCAPAPLLKNHYFVSEAYDARLETPGWDAPGFIAAGWMPAKTIESPTKTLVAQTLPEERVTRLIRPVAVTNPHEGVWVFDMGELIVGCAVLNVHVPAGTALTLRYGEQIFGDVRDYDPRIQGSLLHYDGFENNRPVPGMVSSKLRGNGVMDHGSKNKPGKNQPGFHALTPADVYVAGGNPNGESWHARFAYHPFRYVELIGYPGTPSADVLTGLVVHTDLAKTGSFESSDSMLNQLHEAAANSADYTTHGCVNDNAGTEKQNGLTPAISAGKGSVFFRDVQPLWSKILADMRAVTPESMVPKMFGSGMREPRESVPASVVWTRQGVELPWYYRLHLGDHQVMVTHYSYMKAYVDYFTKSFESNGELPADRFGDHMDFNTAYGKPAPICKPDGTPNTASQEVRYLTDPKLVGAAYVIGMTRKVAEAAALLGKPDDATRYSKLADRMTSKFNEVWFIPERNAYGRRPPAQQFTVQGGSSLALAFDLVPADKRQTVVDALVRDVEAWGGISTGMAATCPLLDVLARNGHAKLALNVLTQTNYPGPGHSLTFGTKTLPEIWAQPNRPSYASLVQSEYVWLARWFYTVLGGINPDSANPGFKHFFLEPVMPEPLKFVSCRTKTPYGEIVSAWRRKGDVIRWNITVPWNTTATVRLPQYAGKISLKGNPVQENKFELLAGEWEVIIKK